MSCGLFLYQLLGLVCVCLHVCVHVVYVFVYTYVFGAYFYSCIDVCVSTDVCIGAFTCMCTCMGRPQENSTVVFWELSTLYYGMWSCQIGLGGLVCECEGFACLHLPGIGIISVDHCTQWDSDSFH